MRPPISSRRSRASLAAVLLLAACGGGGGSDSGQVSPGAGLGAGERAYYLTLFAHTARSASLEASEQVLDAVRELARGGLGRAAAEGLYADLRAALPVRRVRWQGGRAELVGDPAPLVLARGLERVVLVEFENRGAKGRAFSAWVDDPRDGSEAQTPAGAERGVLTRVRADEAGLSHVSLEVSAGAQRDTLALPVRVVEPARIVGTLRDDLSAQSIAARVTVLASDGERRRDAALGADPSLTLKKIAPGELQLAYRVPHFYADGAFAIDVPPGATRVTVERGYEHAAAEVALDLAPGETRAVLFAPQRLFDLRAEGWVSGDTHVHWVENNWYENRALSLLDVVQRAEDVRVVSNLTLRQLNLSAGWQFVKPDQYPMGPVPGHAAGAYLIQMGEEYRNGPFYGHLSFLDLAPSHANPTGLVQPISTGDPLGPFAQDWPTNLAAIDAALAQSPPGRRAVIVASHSIAGSIAAEAALGRIDSIDQAVPADYYRLLDCGLRLALTDGSDHPERVVGAPRCYVKVADPAAPLDYARWADGVLAGASFATSGPLLILTADGVDVGGERSVAAGAVVALRVEARSRRPLGKIEIVSNGGEVLHALETQATSAVIDLPFTADASRWIAARCSAAPQPTWRPLDEPDSAHTSALYLVVDGAPVFADTGAAEELRDRCLAGGDYVWSEGLFDGPLGPTHRREARAVFQAGADAYQALIDAYSSSR